MHYQKRAVTYSALIVVMALVLSVGLLQLTQSSAKSAAPAAALQYNGGTHVLTVTKIVSGAFPLTDWEFTIISDTSEVSNTFYISAAGDTYTQTVESYTTYTVTETPKPGYFVYSGCEPTGTVHLPGFAENYLTLPPPIQPGNSQTFTVHSDYLCTFYNVEASSLTVVKEAIPTSTQPFTFEVNFGDFFIPEGVFPPPLPGPFQLVDDGTDANNSKTISDLVPGSFVHVLEHPVEDWLFSGVVCEDETGAPVGDRFVPEKPANLSSEPGMLPPGPSAGIVIGAGKHYTCTFTNLGPKITLTKTVGAELGACATTDEITIVEGEIVQYCYTMQNTGGLSLTVNSLVDDQLGPVQIVEPGTVQPGGFVEVVEELRTTAMPTITTSNVATWTAYVTHTLPVPAENECGDCTDLYYEWKIYTFTASAVDTARVNVEPRDPSIVLTKTVGTDAGLCAGTDTITVLDGTVVYYCYTVQNTGNVSLPLHSLVDSKLGTLFTGFGKDLGPGESVNTVVDAGLTISASMEVTTTNVATWTAIMTYSVDISGTTGTDQSLNRTEVHTLTAVATDTATVNVFIRDPKIALTKTVGTQEDVCAETDTINVLEGSVVYYCYTVQNTGNYTLGLHGLVDSELDEILNGFEFDLGPGESVSVTVNTGVPVSTTIEVDTTNVATWTASFGDEEISAAADVSNADATGTATATVTVTPKAPSIVVTKTVGMASGVCATTDTITVDQGTTVYYCYAVQNTGNVTLPLHDLVDSELDSIFTGREISLGPGDSVSTVDEELTISATIEVTTTNVATWTAYIESDVAAAATDNGSTSASASDSATVNIFVPVASVDVVKTVGTDRVACGTLQDIAVPLDTQVYFCFTLENTGDVTFTEHTLVDSSLGLTATFPYTLGPGAEVEITNALLVSLGEPPLLGPITVTEKIENTVVFVSTDGEISRGSESRATVVLSPTALDPEGQPGFRRLFLPHIGR